MVTDGGEDEPGYTTTEQYQWLRNYQVDHPNKDSDEAAEDHQCHGEAE